MTNNNTMTRAHAVTRRTCGKWPDADYSATLSAALRQAWQDSTTPAAQLWQAYTDTEKVNALRAMTFYCFKRDKAETTRDGRLIPTKFDWIRSAADFEQVQNEAFCRLPAYFKEGRPLAIALYMAVLMAAQAIRRAEHQNPRALKLAADENGEKLAYIIDHAAPLAERITEPEQATIAREAVREAIDRAAADETDRAIIAAIAAGYTQKEIAAALKMSQVAISHRLQAIKERHAD